MEDRRKRARLIERYVPVTAALGVLCLVAAVAPTLAPDRVQVALESPAASPGGPRGTLPNGGSPSERGGDDGPADPARPADGPSATRPDTAPEATIPGAADLSGTSRAGVECGAGARQVAWTVYAPPCRDAFTGDNGGATAHGVSASTIKVAYRRSNSTQDEAAFAALGSPDFSDDSFVSDLRAYIEIFNRDYELYGRRVELVDFQGRGDWLSEHQGQNLAAAQADAATAKNLPAFADIQFLYKATEAYETYLARAGVLAIGAAGLPQDFYERNAPWTYSPWPTGNKLAGWAVNTACQHLNGRTASFGGDDDIRRTKRVFGIITPDTPGYTASGALMEQGMAGCGAPVGRRIAYSFNIPTFQTQANSIIAQLRAAGVTTVICYCDPLMPAFLTQVADQQRYNPEWMAASLGPTDQLLRYASPNQWQHAISNLGAFPSRDESEAYKVFKLARPHAEPAEEFYQTAYALVLPLFNGLQAAGPNLTPTTFELGTFGLPKTGTGEFGTWGYGTGAFTPGVDTQVGWWSNTRTSAFDGRPGGWQSCSGGAFFPYALSRRAEWGSPGSLRCFE